MKGIISIGDITTSGRTVFSDSVVVKFASIPVAREGGPVLCPIIGHGPHGDRGGAPRV